MPHIGEPDWMPSSKSSRKKKAETVQKNNNSVLLRNGIVPDELKPRCDKALKENKNAWLQSDIKKPLSFSEITRFNTWFLIHPKKVEGKEIITTSREFPISIQGSEITILATITKTLQSKNPESKNKGSTVSNWAKAL
ncbi:MAG: hypothetical protein ACLFUC_06200 [Bacteroidales bacterium]